MLTKALIYLSALYLCQAWPISSSNDFQPLQLRSIMVTCGSNSSEFIHPDDQRRLFTQESEFEILQPGCVIHWRFAIVNLKIEHYGFAIKGNVSINDPLNDDKCGSSALIISEDDEDDHTDKNFITKKYCGQKEFHFVTKEDSVNVQLVVGPTGATGQGFDIMIDTVNECGGIITEHNTVITTPGFPAKYPRDISCLWEVKVDVGSKAELVCDEFNLPPPRVTKYGKKCRHFLLEQTPGNAFHPQKFCGNELKGQKREFGPGETILQFRSTKSTTKANGFHCTVKYTAASNARIILENLVI